MEKLAVKIELSNDILIPIKKGYEAEKTILEIDTNNPCLIRDNSEVISTTYESIMNRDERLGLLGRLCLFDLLKKVSETQTKSKPIILTITAEEKK